MDLVRNIKTNWDLQKDKKLCWGIKDPPTQPSMWSIKKQEQQRRRTTR